MHKQAFDLRTGQCLDDAAVRVPTYDVRVADGMVLRRLAEGGVRDRSPSRCAGFRIGVTAARKVDEQVALLERRGASVEWAPALSMDPNHVDDAELRAATDEVLSRPVDMFLATTGIGMKAWFAAAERWGILPTTCWPRWVAAEILARGPKSVGALRRRGLRELWAPESECFEDVLEHLRGRVARRAADRRAGARPVAVDGRARAAPAGRGRHDGDRLPGRVGRRPGADVQADRPDRRPRARRGRRSPPRRPSPR